MAHRHYLPSALDTEILYNKNNKVASDFIYNGQFVSVIHERGYNGLPVYAMCERVNRYTVNLLNMLTLTI